ncbi:MAG: hypothetical protein L6308_02575 [Candidatus Omnitrophica bacterium]|nr:hypothetical protein [Candidatus Omnitrophota bacterium]
MRKRSLLGNIKELGAPVFTTFELSASSGKSSSVVIQGLNNLVEDGLIIKVYRGIWAQVGNEQLSPYAVISCLLTRHRAYVSFISALYLYNIVEQIPQVITLASTSHTKLIRTKLGVFSFHQLTPKFFSGFNWYKACLSDRQGGGKFLIAEPEKALVDSFYLSACRKKQFGHFPELSFPKSFSFKKVKQWALRIPDPKIRAHVFKKIEAIAFKKSQLSPKNVRR